MASLSGALSVHAQTGAPASSPAAGGANFETHKQKELAHIQQRQQALQQLQTCVNAATTPAALRQCHQAARAEQGGGGGCARQ